MNTQSYNSWTFERPFHLESDSSLDEVVHALAALEDDGGFFSSTRHEISILPANEGYTFRYDLRRRSKRRSYTTATAEGDVWQEEDGLVVVEGIAHINPWSMYGTIGLLIVMALIFTVMSKGFAFIPLVLAGVGAYSIFSYYSDRNRVIDRLTEAIRSSGSLTGQFRDKAKHASRPEKVKNTRLNVDEAKRRPGSVWNEAISEYENDRNYDDK